jgi:hypothetical protein
MTNACEHVPAALPVQRRSVHNVDILQQDRDAPPNVRKLNSFKMSSEF